MIVSLLNEENITLMCGDKEIPIYNLRTSEDGYEVGFDAKHNLNTLYSVIISKYARNSKGVTMKEDKKLDFLISE